VAIAARLDSTLEGTFRQLIVSLNLVIMK